MIKKIFFIIMAFMMCATAIYAEETMENKDQVLKTAIFAGGCFWCMEKPYEQYDGIKKVISGYTGGAFANPVYQDVSHGKTDHVEAVQITYDPEIISYTELLDIFWRQIDPTDDGGQFADRGNHYKTAIFYSDDQEKDWAEKSKKDLGESGTFDQPIATKILKATVFYDAEDYHQDYYKKHPDHYNSYHHHSGRGPFIERVWGKKDK